MPPSRGNDQNKVKNLNRSFQLDSCKMQVCQSHLDIKREVLISTVYNLFHFLLF